MSADSINKRLEEYFVIRVEHRVTERQPDLATRDIFLDKQDRLVPLKQARQFVTAEEAERHIQQLPAQDHYQFIIQFCSRERKSENPDEFAKFIDRIMEIPYPYRRTAYNWLRGRDVKALLLRESEEVYQRHRKVLLDHDIDITRKSDIILLKPKRKKFKIDARQPDGAPRQYFAYPDQKPVPLAADDDEVE